MWALTAYVEWLASELGVVGAYETQMGIDLLLGDDERRNGVRRVLKLGGSEQPDVLADRCWNAAWDILFLRITEGATYGLLEGAAERAITLLVTKNRDPGFVRAQSEIRHVSTGTAVPSPCTSASRGRRIQS
jgi:hypothetical protein